jgi:hypothetical protein
MFGQGTAVFAGGTTAAGGQGHGIARWQILSTPDGRGQVRMVTGALARLDIGLTATYCGGQFSQIGVAVAKWDCGME